MIKRFYLDTYALIEIGKGNPKYEPYKEDVMIILSKLNLLEFSYCLFKEKKENEVKEIFERYLKYDVDYDQETVIKAAEMKFKFLKERLSFIDCIGYFLAKKHNAKFLTGDEKFRNMDNVEFVK
jgi:predicted nucleic acid-binding protein